MVKPPAGLNSWFFRALLGSFWGGWLVATAGLAHAQSVSIPLDEQKSAPAIDLLDAQSQPLDPGKVMEEIQKGLDSSTFEPRPSDVYGVKPSSTVFPSADTVIRFERLVPANRGLVRAIVGADGALPRFHLLVSLDAHAALARHALLSRLGYRLPPIQHYSRLKVQFQNLETRNQFLNQIADRTLTARGRWVQGGLEEIKKNLTQLTFQNVVLEPTALETPPFHWGVVHSQNLQSRRSIRALIVPLALLDVPESVNLYSFEAAKIIEDQLVFMQPSAPAFQQETSIGDVKWIAKKIAAFSRADWTAIIQAGHYPPDIQALIVEKTLARTQQLLELVEVPSVHSLEYDPHLSYGQVVQGKAIQETYEGYALRFTYGDPQNPLRASELLRFFGIESISGALGFLLETVGRSLQIITPDQYILKNNESILRDVEDHLKNRPNDPYIQPIKSWGGPIAGGRLQASRNVMTGTYYGSQSAVQLVDSVSAGVNIGAFIGLSGVGPVRPGFFPQIQYNRSYVHVRPIEDIKTAWKDGWKNLLVPHFMKNLSRLLNGQANGQDDSASRDAIKDFLSHMKPGEIFMITDGFSAGTSTTVGVPLGAILGLAAPFFRIGESATFGHQYGILSRTTLYRSEQGLQIQLSRIQSNQFDFSLDTEFVIKLLGFNSMRMNGHAQTRAYVFPETFDDEEKATAFQRAVASLLKNNNPAPLEEDFIPYRLDHEAQSKRNRFQIGPWSWTKREHFHRLAIDRPDLEKRTLLQGQLTKIQGSDLYGFFGRLVRRFIPFVSLGRGGAGDDPSTQFLGRSKTLQVSTEMELTPGRPPQWLTRLQLSLNGWSMNKNRLLKILEQTMREVRDIHPGPYLVQTDQFSQTKKIQAYQVSSSWIVNEQGLSRLLQVFDLEKTSARRAYELMQELEGANRLEQWCASQGLIAGLESGPWITDDDDPAWIEATQGNLTKINCLKPWMQTVFRFRSQLTRERGVFLESHSSEESALARIRWINRIVMALESQMEISQLIQWVGQSHSSFQVRVSGFRTHDETADSQRYSSYFSNTIGSLNQDSVRGAFAEVSDATQILDHELSARYFSNGY